MTKKETQNILSYVQYKDWDILLREDGDRLYLQCQFKAPCSVTGAIKTQHCRKWMLSPHMTRTEVVTTAWKAVIAAEEHEAREHFKYKGQPIFNRHIDVEYLTTLCFHEKYDSRMEKS
jgi:hypothetical protein